MVVTHYIVSLNTMLLRKQHTPNIVWMVVTHCAVSLNTMLRYIVR